MGEERKRKKKLIQRNFSLGRKKKSKYIADLKALATESDLPLGAKDIMIKAVLKHEAKARAEKRAHEAKIRNVVVKKKEELENTSLAELGKQCESINAKGVKGK